MEEIEKRLGASGPVAMLGYVFDASWAAKNKAAVGRFLHVAAEAKEILAASPDEWRRLSARIGVTDAASLDIYRRRYSEGIPRRAIADEERDAIGLYRVLAEAGGPELVGPAREMDKGTFYDPEKSD
jgi:NitT/TauT family transport system substrate-binding protein